ncbi:uncharacterized protein At2g29880-like [Salvia miltiorrhiza]|uniref:uncharacterized protein At2g29880-like n=1 Tax=Salvia miltiorrhiza TaxID=226208 RepID=UPI0025ACDA6B|nr:uncharacterized protein At2g29880-like [Salvia miltiorrhiza]
MASPAHGCGNETASNDISRGQANKIDKSRWSWSAKEETVLVNALKSLVADGWKSDNGFRAGFLGKLEEALRKEFPGTDLKANQHINSKIGTWKKNYYSLNAMFSKSGFGFNVNGDYMIDINNEQWEQIMKVDNNARNMRYKSWPLYDDWKIIFGKDRATGNRAEDFMEAVNDMIGQHNIAYEVNNDEITPPPQGEEELLNDVAEGSVCDSQKCGRERRNAGRKHKRDDGLDGVHELLLEIGRNTDKRLEHIGNRIGYEFDLAQARSEVFETVCAIPGLNISDKFDVCEILVIRERGSSFS